MKVFIDFLDNFFNGLKLSVRQFFFTLFLLHNMIEYIFILSYCEGNEFYRYVVDYRT